MSDPRLIFDFDSSNFDFFSENVGEGFPEACVALGRAKTLECVARDQRGMNSHRRLKEMAGRRGLDARVTHSGSLTDRMIGNRTATLLVDPATARASFWYRDTYDIRQCALVALCGTTRAFELVRIGQDAAVAPLYPWDRLVFTTRAAAETAVTQYGRHTLFLQGRTQGKQATGPGFTVIPHGIDTSRYAEAAAAGPQAKSRWALPDGVRVIVVEAQALAGERVQWALVGALRAVGGTTHVRVAGAAPAAADIAAALVRIAALSGVDATAAAHPEADADPLAWAGADAAVALPGVSNGFIVRALACGIPVVAPDAKHIRELVEHGKTGILVPTSFIDAGIGLKVVVGRVQAGTPPATVDDEVRRLTMVEPAALGQALRSLFDAPELAAPMRAAARAAAVGRHDWTRIIPHYDRLFAEVDGALTAALGGGYRNARLRHDDTAAALRASVSAVLSDAVWIGGPGEDAHTRVAAVLDGVTSLRAKNMDQVRECVQVLGNLFTAYDAWKVGELIGITRPSQREPLISALHLLISVGVLRPLGENEPSGSAG